MRIHKFLNKRYALKSMRERRLKISRLSELNDPFEMLPFDLSSRVARLSLAMTLREFDERKGLMCFSRTWTNPVIWAHYADQHRGLCLGFDVPDALIKEISYTKTREPYPLDLFDSDEAEQLRLTDRLLFTKFEDWRYEDEIRVSVLL